VGADVRVRIACLDYADFLTITLPGWAGVCPAGSLSVVTAARDEATQQVAADNGVPVFITDAWTRHDPTYKRDTSHWNGLWRERGAPDRYVVNKALALDEAFGFVGTRTPRPRDGEICLSVDADCLPVGELPDPDLIRHDVIYGCKRFNGRINLSRGDEMVLKGRICRSQHRATPCVGGGYFQLFRYAAGHRFGSYRGADGYDYDFAFGFQKGIELKSIHVLHFGDAERNWWGRVTPRFKPQVNA
jgi:hypothetical protein